MSEHNLTASESENSFLCELRPETVSFFSDLRQQVAHGAFLQKTFGDFSQFLLEYEGGVEVRSAAQQELSALLQTFNIVTVPVIKRGAISRQLDSPIVLFHGARSINNGTPRMQEAILLLKVAATMAYSDRLVREQEIDRLLSVVVRLRFVNPDEKAYLKAQALYMCAARTRRDLILEKLTTVSDRLKKPILDAAMDIAIADGVLKTGELHFLQDLYRAFDMSARSARTDLERYARDQFVVIEEMRNDHPSEPDEVMEELEDVLGDLLDEFDF